MSDATPQHPEPTAALLGASTARQWASSGPVATLAAAIASDPSAAAEPDDPVEYARYAIRWRLLSASDLSRVRSVRYLAECRRKVLDVSA